MDLARIKELAAKAEPVLPGRPPNPLVDGNWDGDYMAYYFAGKDTAALGECKANALDFLARTSEAGGIGGEKIIHLTAGGSHKGGRYKAATIKPYQGNRDNKGKPRNWEGMRLWLETLKHEGYRVIVWEDREADDGIAYHSRRSWLRGRVPAIIMKDKDSRMIPATHIDWSTLTVWDTTPETWYFDTGHEDSYGPVIYGGWFYWYQLLAGDSADHIPGLEKAPGSKPGSFVQCGGKTAAKLLEGCKTHEAAFAVVRELYRAYYGDGGWPDRLAEQMCLLWLRTDKEADLLNFEQALPSRHPHLVAACDRLERRCTA